MPVANGAGAPFPTRMRADAGPNGFMCTGSDAAMGADAGMRPGVQMRQLGPVRVQMRQLGPDARADEASPYGSAPPPPGPAGPGHARGGG